MPRNQSLSSPLGRMNTKLCLSFLDSSMSSISEMHMEWLSLGIKLPSFLTLRIQPEIPIKTVLLECDHCLNLDEMCVWK